MAEKGLLTETELSRKHIDATWGIKERDIVVNSYDLTEEGKNTTSKMRLKICEVRILVDSALEKQQ
ncbi:hypothetical protein [Klebsiella pneumoniae]|nr:hypothetical protein [Klebsiella pneumoniae]QSS11338.1 hypothetical protein H4I73_28455 [Klebsiella pneumoniae]